MKTVNLNIRIDDELKKEFYDVADGNTQTPSALVRKWIKDYIKENKKTS